MFFKFEKILIIITGLLTASLIVLGSNSNKTKSKNGDKTIKPLEGVVDFEISKPIDGSLNARKVLVQNGFKIKKFFGEREDGRGKYYSFIVENDTITGFFHIYKKGGIRKNFYYKTSDKYRIE